MTQGKKLKPKPGAEGVLEDGGCKWTSLGSSWERVRTVDEWGDSAQTVLTNAISGDEWAEEDSFVRPEEHKRIGGRCLGKWREGKRAMISGFQGLEGDSRLCLWHYYRASL